MYHSSVVWVISCKRVVAFHGKSCFYIKLLDLHSLYQITFQELLLLVKQSWKKAASWNLIRYCTECFSRTWGRTANVHSLKWASLSFYSNSERSVRCANSWVRFHYYSTNDILGENTNKTGNCISPWCWHDLTLRVQFSSISRLHFGEDACHSCGFETLQIQDFRYLPNWGKNEIGFSRWSISH